MNIFNELKIKKLATVFCAESRSFAVDDETKHNSTGPIKPLIKLTPKLHPYCSKTRHSTPANARSKRRQTKICDIASDKDKR